MTDVNKKSIFALFAVALMVFSACAVLAANEDPVKADKNTIVDCTEPLNIEYGQNGWSITLYPEEGGVQGKCKLEGDVLTIEDLEMRVNGPTDHAIMISAEASQSAQKLTVVFKGANNVIVHNPPTDITTSSVILINNVDLTIKCQAEEGSMSLFILSTEVAKGVNLSSSSGIGYAGDGHSSCQFIDVSMTILPGVATKSCGLQTAGDISMKNSNVTIFGSTEPGCIYKDATGIKSNGALKLEDTTLEMESKVIDNAVGIDVNTFSAIKSNVTIKSGDGDESIGIQTNVVPENIDNCVFDITAYGSAVIAGTDTPWKVSAFKNMIVKGSEDMMGEPTAITTDTIPTNYQLLKGEMRSNYTVTFDIDGGQGNTPGPVTVAEGTSFTLPDAKDFKKDGYTFKGWSDGTTTHNAGQPYTPTSDITLKAVWEQNSSGGGDDNTTLIICVVLAIVILVGCGAYAYFKKFKQ